MHFAKSKVLKIHDRNWPRTNTNAPNDKIILPHTHITFPNNSSINIKGNNLNKLGFKLSLSPLKRSVIKYNRHLDIISDAGIYCIPCKDLNRNI